MKIALNITVDVDAQAWAQDWGIEAGEVREDVIAYVRNLLNDECYAAREELWKVLPR